MKTVLTILTCLGLKHGQRMSIGQKDQDGYYAEKCCCFSSKLALKGIVTQNIFSLKSGPKDCKDLGKVNDLKKIIRKKEKTIKFDDIFGPLKLCLHDFLEQSLHCSIILRGKEQSLYDFAGQRTMAL